MIESLIGRRWVPWVIAIGLMAAVGWMAASFKGCSDNRVERKRIDTMPALADRNLEAIKAQIAVKDAIIENLREQIESFTCDGELTRIAKANGDTEMRCTGKSRSDRTDTGASSSRYEAPRIVLPAVPPDLTPPVTGGHQWTWMLAGGAGFAQGSPLYAVQVGRRVWGPLGAELTVLYPLGALGGVVACW